MEKQLIKELPMYQLRPDINVVYVDHDDQVASVRSVSSEGVREEGGSEAGWGERESVCVSEGERSR